MRSQEEVDEALRLLAQDRSPTEVARATSIPRSTVRDWSYGWGLRSKWRRRSRGTNVPCREHDFAGLDARCYAYLLGIYLGDGCISEHRRGVFHLRITLDARYGLIVEECRRAVSAIVPRKRAGVTRRRDGNCVEVSSYWKHWPCLLPRHGPGRKHERRIQLVDWQRVIVEAHPEPFLRSLIHSDGCRFIATERKGSYVRRAPRYAFSNHSEDILQLFANACDRIGVHHTRASWKQIAIYSKASVTRLDEFIGPKQ